jgi:hypothetical protein
MIHDLHAALLPKMRERKSQAILAPVRKAKRFSVDTRARKFLINMCPRSKLPVVMFDLQWPTAAIDCEWRQIKC